VLLLASLCFEEVVCAAEASTALAMAAAAAMEEDRGPVKPVDPTATSLATEQHEPIPEFLPTDEWQTVLDGQPIPRVCG